MSFFPDLTPYRYGFGPAPWDQNGPPSLEPTELYGWMWDAQNGAFDLSELNVGWIEAPHDYPRGELPSPLVEKLDRLCRASRFHLTRGFQPCGICGDCEDGLGSAEIRLRGEGVVYAAPNKVAHHVAAHGYAPPAGFVAALERCEGLVEPRRGLRRSVTIDMIPRDHVDVSVLEAEVRGSMRRNYRERIFPEVSLHARGDVVAVFARIAFGERHDLTERSWNIPRVALLNMTQATYAIVSMLESVHTEMVLALFEQRRRERDPRP